jgi:hypothetical protein
MDIRQWWEARMTTATDSLLRPGAVTFQAAVWPRNIWSAGRLVVRTSLDSSQAIDVLSERLKAEFGYRRALQDPFDAEALAKGITYLRPLPWKPKWPSAVFEGMVQESESGAVISGNLRLPWWPLIWCCLCLLGGVLISLGGVNPASFIFPTFGAIVYLGGRFVSLPAAQASLLAWFGASPIARAARPWSPRRRRIVIAATLGLEVLLTGALFLWYWASVVANPAFLQNPLTTVFGVAFGVVFATTLIANGAIWRQWRGARWLGFVAAGLMAITGIGIVLAIPQFIATMAATGTGGRLPTVNSPPPLAQ